jgi:hypothetical protein
LKKTPEKFKVYSSVSIAMKKAIWCKTAENPKKDNNDIQTPGWLNAEFTITHDRQSLYT